MNLNPALLLAVALGECALGTDGGLLFFRRKRLANVFCFNLAALSALSGLPGALLFLVNGAGNPAPPIRAVAAVAAPSASCSTRWT